MGAIAHRERHRHDFVDVPRADIEQHYELAGDVQRRGENRHRRQLLIVSGSDQLHRQAVGADHERHLPGWPNRNGHQGERTGENVNNELFVPCGHSGVAGTDNKRRKLGRYRGGAGCE
jgi:hypothetical protein